MNFFFLAPENENETVLFWADILKLQISSSSLNGLLEVSDSWTVNTNHRAELDRYSTESEDGKVSPSAGFYGQSPEDLGLWGSVSADCR